MTPRVRVEITSEAIDCGGLIAAVRGDGDGAVASFFGVVREQNHDRQVLGLDYETYLPMAELELRRIAGSLAGRHELGGIAIVHRVGSLGVGETSLAVVTAAPHRVAAFDACREAVEVLKRELPIWKREHHPDGAHWVDARELEGEHG
jgi:molybdopterin synthase catalytic subunit